MIWINKIDQIKSQKWFAKVTLIVKILSPKPVIEKGQCSNTIMMKPPPNLRREKYLLNSKKDDEFLESLIGKLQKMSIKGKEKETLGETSISVITKESNYKSSSSEEDKFTKLFVSNKR